MKKDFICLECENPTHRLILLHGWGADAEDLIPLAEELVKSLNVRFELIFFRAPEPKPDGIGRQWYGLFPADWSSVPGAIKNLKERFQKLDLIRIPLSKTFLRAKSMSFRFMMPAVSIKALF